MKFQRILFLLLIAIGLFSSSCQNSSTAFADDAIANIPSTSSSVTSLNLKKLMDKADFAEVQKMSFYKDMVKEASMGNPGIVAVLNDPYKSGIDLDANIYMTQEMNIDPDKGFTAVVTSLKDKSAFEALLTSEGNADLKSGDGFQYSQPNRSGIISWNDNIAVFGMTSGRGVDLKESVAKIYNTTPETSVANNEDLKKCFSKDADMVSWFGSNSMAESAAEGGMSMQMAMAGFSPDMLKDNYAHSYFNFEKGEIISESNYSINEKLADEFRHIFKDDVNTDFSKYLPAENLVYAVSAGLDIKGVKMILEKKGMAGMGNSMLKQYGLTVEGLANTFDGDLLVSGYKVDGEINPNMLIATKIKDMDYFKQILDLGKEYSMVSSTEENLYNLIGANSNDGFGANPQIYISGDMVFIGDGNTSIGKIKSGAWSKSTLVDSKVKNIISDNILGAFVNFQTIGKYIENQGMNLDAMNDGVLSFDRDDALIKVEMKDKSINSLKALMQWANENYKSSM